MAQCDGVRPAGAGPETRRAAEVQVRPGLLPRHLLQRSALCGGARYSVRDSLSVMLIGMNLKLFTPAEVSPPPRFLTESFIKNHL